MHKHVAGRLNEDGSFKGNLKQYGCRNQHPIRFSGYLTHDKIHAEFFTSASGNPPEFAAQKLTGTLPIRDDGSFGGSEGEDYRFWLRYRPSGGPKYQWPSGRVLKHGVYVKLTFGSPKYPSSYCKAEGISLV